MNQRVIAKKLGIYKVISQKPLNVLSHWKCFGLTKMSLLSKTVAKDIWETDQDSQRLAKANYKTRDG